MRLTLNIIKWIIAGILSFFGVSMIVGFFAELFDGKSEQSLWFDLGFVTLVGLVPLGGGIMLFLMKLPWPQKRLEKDR